MIYKVIVQSSSIFFKNTKVVSMCNRQTLQLGLLQTWGFLPGIVAVELKSKILASDFFFLKLRLFIIVQFLSIFATALPKIGVF